MATITLLEPGYRTKYPPLGLMKLAAYHRGRNDTVHLRKGRVAPGLLDRPPERVYVATMFTYEWTHSGHAIDDAIALAGGDPRRVIAGGVAVSMMPEAFRAETRWKGVRFITGTLERPANEALQLTPDEFDSAETTRIDALAPDYAILEDLAPNQRYTVEDAYFGFATRGCIRKCAFCGVPKIEGQQRDMAPVTALIDNVRRAHGERCDLILMDNNVVASGRFHEIIAEIRDNGFHAGARLQSPRRKRPRRRRVDFNQGLDARILARTPGHLQALASIAIKPVRIAFDHAGMRKVYSQAVRNAAAAGLNDLSNYLLYNFRDTPADLYARMHLNIELAAELEIRIWSFPMRYQPITAKNRAHVGPNWSAQQLRAVQIMLNATHGVVSAKADFFEYAYGATSEAFQALLELPDAMLTYRDHFLHGPGRPTYDSYHRSLSNLGGADRETLRAIVHQPDRTPGERRRRYRTEAHDRATPAAVREVLHYHIQRPPRNAEQAQRGLELEMPDPAERVVDAGVDDPTS